MSSVSRGTDMAGQRARSNLRIALALGLLALCSLMGFVYKVWSFG